MQSNFDSTLPLKVLPWSISSLTAYETCPRRRYLTGTKQSVPEPQTAATIEGNEVHKSLELAVKGTQGLPPKHQVYQPIIMRVLAAKGAKEAERNFGLTPSYKPAGFWDKSTWVRGKIDLTIQQPETRTALALDWKTGKRKTDDTRTSGQLALTAAVIFAELAWVEKVKTGYVWLKTGQIDQETYTRADVPAIWDGFNIRVQRMVRSAETGSFPARPSGLCREWCPVGKNLCEHCGG